MPVKREYRKKRCPPGGRIKNSLPPRGKAVKSFILSPRLPLGGLCPKRRRRRIKRGHSQAAARLPWPNGPGNRMPQRGQEVARELFGKSPPHPSASLTPSPRGGRRGGCCFVSASNRPWRWSIPCPGCRGRRPLRWDLPPFSIQLPLAVGDADFHLPFFVAFFPGIHYNESQQHQGGGRYGF